MKKCIIGANSDSYTIIILFMLRDKWNIFLFYMSFFMRNALLISRWKEYKIRSYILYQKYVQVLGFKEKNTLHKLMV